MAINTTRPSRPNICIFFILLRLICRLVYEVYEKVNRVSGEASMEERWEKEKRREER